VPFFGAPDGTRLHYEIEGSGPPLILHLGAGCDSGLWRAAGYVEPLAKAYSCVLYDHRGHGQSDHPTSAAANHVDRLAEDVAALIRNLGYAKAAFVGWSGGMTVGLRAAEQYPELIDALVLIGGLGRRLAQHEVEAAVPQRVASLTEKGWWSIIGPMIPAEKFPVPQWFIDRVLATDIEPVKAWHLARPAWKWSPWDAIPKITAPTLMMAGELEDPEDILSEAAALMADATRVRIPDREHINAFLYSEFVVPRVLAFLKARERQATG